MMRILTSITLVLCLFLTYAQNDWDTSTSGQITYVSGNVGIGTSSPGEQLSLLGNKPVIRLQSTSSGNSAYAWLEYNDTNSRLGYVGFGSSGNSNLYLMNEASGNILIPNGNVGIGHNSPNAQLVIGTGFGATISGSGGGNAVFGSNIAINEGGSNHNLLYTPNSHNANYGYAGMHARWGSLHFYTSDGNTTANNVVYPTTRMFINSSGNIGIGTNSPYEKLQVNGNAAIIGDIIMDYGKALKIDTDWNGGGESKILKTGWDSSRDDFLDFYVPGNQSVGQTPRLSLNQNGNVGIGTTTPTHKLEVNGTIRSKEVKVEASPWPDYVFEESYELRTLEETEAFIKANKHLPEIPSAKEIEASGLELGEMNRLLLQKVEELTLYVIELKKEVENLKSDKQ